MSEKYTYILQPEKYLRHKDKKIASFDLTGSNIDHDTVESFGDEWHIFKTFSEAEINSIGKDYFDLIDLSSLQNALCLDVGCGTGRWSKFLAPYVRFIECIDPSSAVFVASDNLSHFDNCRVTQAGTDFIPFPDDSFDFIFSLGVLHHIPDTLQAMQSCVKKLKPGGIFLVYLYYNLDNRSGTHKFIFRMSNLLRKIVCRFPATLKRFTTDFLAVLLYAPFVAFSIFLQWLGMSTLAEKVPLSYYKKTSWKIIRNDALDRFGTPLEQRFSKVEIEDMMRECGLTNIQFSPNAPFWHACGRKE